MTLEANLTVKLDAGSLVSALLAELAGPAAQLTGLELPANAGDLSLTVEGTADIDLAALTSSVESLAARGSEALTALPGAGEVVQQITALLELIEQVTAGDLGERLEELLASLAEEVEGSRDGGLIARLTRLAEMLTAAPEGQVLLSTLLSLTGGESALPTEPLRKLGDLLPALDAAVRGLGALMSLETVLSEAERVTGILAAQLDPQRIEREIGQLVACFGSGSGDLAVRLTNVDAAHTAEVEAVVLAVQQCADQLARIEASLQEAMGLGEATLTYLDVGKVEAQAAAAAALLRGLDFAPLERLIATAVDAIDPLINFDLDGAPSFTLDGLLTLAEAELAQHVAKIEGLDPANLTAPLADGIDAVTGLADRLSEAIAEISVTARGALQEVRALVAELPFDEITSAIDTVLTPAVTVIEAIRELVENLQAALETAATEATDAITLVETAIDGFKAQIDLFFGEARGFVTDLGLQAVIGEVTGKVQELADILAKAEMKPYFDTTTGTIQTTADVVAAVPFGLLPESMKADVDAAVKPVKEVDVRAVETEIRGGLGLGPDGQLELRGILEEAVKDLEDGIDAVIAVVAEHDPRKHLTAIDQELVAIAQRISELSPNLALEPVSDAIAEVQGVIGGLDLQAALAPLSQLFTDVDEALERYSPAQLVEPLEEKLVAARTEISALLKIDEWQETLDQLAERARELLAVIDPEELQEQIAAGLSEAEALLASVPAGHRSTQWLGSIVAGFLAGSGIRAAPWTFGHVLDWLDGEDGCQALCQRTERLAAAISHTRDAVSAIDLPALSVAVTLKADALRPAAEALAAQLPADSPLARRLVTATGRLEVEAVFGPLATNRGRYLQALEAAVPLGETLRRTGLSEVEVALGRLRAAFAPLATLTGRGERLLLQLGLSGFEEGIVGVVRQLLASAPPERLASLATPIFTALHGRFEVLLESLIEPLATGITRLRDLLDSLTLQPLIDELDGAVDDVRAQIAAFDPTQILAEPLAALTALQDELTTFDPLAPIVAVLDALRDAAARTVAKLSTEELLATPLEVYDQILAEIGALQLSGLLAPMLDQLDALGVQFDVGLEETVTAFENLQAALPSGGGGSSVSVSVEIGGG